MNIFVRPSGNGAALHGRIPFLWSDVSSERAQFVREGRNAKRSHPGFYWGTTSIALTVA